MLRISVICFKSERCGAPLDLFIFISFSLLLLFIPQFLKGTCYGYPSDHDHFLLAHKCFLALGVSRLYLQYVSKRYSESSLVSFHPFHFHLRCCSLCSHWAISQKSPLGHELFSSLGELSGYQSQGQADFSCESLLNSNMTREIGPLSAHDSLVALRLHEERQE